MVNKPKGRPRKETAVSVQNQNEAATEVVKQKRKRPDLTEMFSPQTEPGDISRMLGQAITISHWPPIDTDDADALAERIDQYHRYCFDNDIKPDMVGMALAVGVSRKTLWAWENGVDSDKPQAVRNTLKKARTINEYLMSQMMQTGKINPVSGIFLLKNNFEYKDQQDVVITPNNPLEGNADDIRNRYIKAIPEETEET